MNTPRIDPTITLGQLLTMISVLIGALGVGGAGVGVWVSLNNTLVTNSERIHGLENTASQLRDVTKDLSQSMKELVAEKITDATQSEQLRNLDTRLTALESRVTNIEMKTR